MKSLILSKAKKIVAESKASGPSAESGSTNTEKRGEQREGKYAARVQVGYEKDGSPQYRYFKTIEQYKTYLDNKSSFEGEGKNKKKTHSSGSSKLKEKMTREQRESKDKSGNLKSQEKNLFVKKSLDVRLYIR